MKYDVWLQSYIGLVIFGDDFAGYALAPPGTR